jgi:hypothetical protein
MAELLAGVAARDISPTSPLFLVGYPHVERFSRGIHDPLLVTAIHLGDGETGLLSIAVDLLFVPHELTGPVREEIAAATGVPVEHVMISATHTHSGPVTNEILSWREDPLVPPPDPAYLAQVKQALVAAATEAVAQAAPAELAVTTAPSEGVGGNRLSPDAVRDPDVGLVYLRSLPDHRPLALLSVYSMHPTVLHEDSPYVSADFPGYTRLLVERALPGVRLAYHNGPCGNLSPRYHVRGQTFAEARRLGESLGQQILSAIAELADSDFRSDIRLAAAREFIDLPPRDFGTVEQAEQELAEAVAEYERLKAAGAPHGPVRTAECTVFGAEERVTLARAQAEGATAKVLDEYLPVEIQALRLGNAFLACLPGECFVEYALELKRRVPNAFVVSLANGELQGYIPTPDATGYEARLSFFEPEAGLRMIETAAQLAAGLK